MRDYTVSRDRDVTPPSGHGFRSIMRPALGTHVPRRTRPAVSTVSGACPEFADTAGPGVSGPTE